MIERDFDISFIAEMALREKQIQQSYRPIIAVHKWFARRPGTLFRGLILSEFVSAQLRESFYQRNNLSGLNIADPMMGGGTPLVEANRLGCNIMGWDISPLAYWIVKQEIEHLDINAYWKSAQALGDTIERKIGHLYQTRCLECNSQTASAKYFLWVKTQDCLNCGKEVSLFPTYLISENSRHPKYVVLCPRCGCLNENENKRNPGNCVKCGFNLSPPGTAKGNRCICPHCHHLNRYPRPEGGPPKHRMFAIEYYCASCKPRHEGRFFKTPDADDFSRLKEAESLWSQTQSKFVPDDEIPAGDETGRLHRWGYRRYREMFNVRQLLGLETICRFIDEGKNERIHNALATNVSDLLRYQNMLCRYDAMALKSLDIFSIHGFPVSLIQCESNILGIRDDQTDMAVGSGGWLNIIEKFSKAKSYCESPFEFRHQGKKKTKVNIQGEWIGDSRNGERRDVRLFCADAAHAMLQENSLDAVFTDPPYFGNVQYAELMDFCYVWLRKLLGKTEKAFRLPSTRNINELTGNKNMGRGLEHFTDGLSLVFQHMVRGLKPGAPLVFTYHHNELSSYYPIAVAILDAGFACSASLPCPAEMGASIHIARTISSIIDTVFVCRTTGKVPQRWIAGSPPGVAEIVRDDLQKLRLGGVNPTTGDLRCIVFGHLIRLAVWNHRIHWDKTTPTKTRLSAIGNWIETFGGSDAVMKELEDQSSDMQNTHELILREKEPPYRTGDAEISF